MSSYFSISPHTSTIKRFLISSHFVQSLHPTPIHSISKSKFPSKMRVSYTLHRTIHLSPYLTSSWLLLFFNHFLQIHGNGSVPLPPPLVLPNLIPPCPLRCHWLSHLRAVLPASRVSCWGVLLRHGESSGRTLRVAASEISVPDLPQDHEQRLYRACCLPGLFGHSPRLNRAELV